MTSAAKKLLREVQGLDAEDRLAIIHKLFETTTIQADATGKDLASELEDQANVMEVLARDEAMQNSITDFQ